MSSIKRIKTGKDGADAVAKGIEIVRDTVGCTMGYAGNTVMIDIPVFGAYATKDGVSVANEIRLKNPYEDMGAQMIIQAASTTAHEAGDGTTTATVLASSMCLEGIKLSEDGFNSTEISKGMKEASKVISEILDGKGIDVTGDKERLYQIANISANGDEEIARVATDVVMAINDVGDVIIQKTAYKETMFEVSTGYSYDHGLMSHSFETTSGSLTMEYENAKILIVNDLINEVADVEPFIKMAVASHQPLVIVCEQVSNEVIVGLARAKSLNKINVGIVGLPDYADRRIQSLNDLADCTGATVVSRDSGLSIKDANWSHVGECKEIKASMSSTTIHFHDHLTEKVEEICKQLKETMEVTEENTSEYGFLRERHKRLSNGIGIVKISANSDVEFKEKYDRMEDAINAVRSAAKEGIIKGGGLGLYETVRVYEKKNKKVDSKKDKAVSYHAYKNRTPSFNVGFDIVIQCCKKPIETILGNAGADITTILSDIENKYKFKLGYNVASMKYEDLIKGGIIDPLKVTKTALKNATSVASTFLTTKAFITMESYFDN